MLYSIVTIKGILRKIAVFFSLCGIDCSSFFFHRYKYLIRNVNIFIS